MAAWALPAWTAALLFLAHLNFGSNANAPALVMATAWCATAALITLPLPWTAEAGREALPPQGVIVTFILVVIIVAFQLAPALDYLADPIWLLADATPAWTLDRDATTRELLKLVSLAAAFVVGMRVGRRQRSAQALFIAISLGGAAYALWAFLSFMAQPDMVFQIEKTIHEDRLTASFLSANSAALAIGMTAIIASGLGVRALKKAVSRSRSGELTSTRHAATIAVSVIAVVLSAACIILSASRAGGVIFILALFLFVAWEAGARHVLTGRIVALAAVIAALALLLLFNVLGEGLSDRLEGALATDGRWLTYRTHVEAFLARPWLGYGLGTFTTVNDLYQTAGNTYILSHQNAVHNVFLSWLEGVGIVGSLPMFTCVALVLGEIWRGLQTRMRMKTWLRAILVASLLPLTHGFLDYGLEVPSIAWFWALLLGVGCGLSNPAGGRRARSEAFRSR